MKICVYTVLIGDYEALNEQPVANRSSIPFLCLTDNPELKSETWDVRLVTPVFSRDPIRSQRDVKIRPHLHLPDFDASLYVDNTVLLSEPPEKIWEQYAPETGIALPLHSYRETVLDEFLAVSQAGFDDQGRIFEQLNHYAIDCPELLSEKPYWSAILLRDHTRPQLREMSEAWAVHTHRYSRRDQLSLNMAFRSAKLEPRTIEIDNHDSWFHSWPHANERRQFAGDRKPAMSLTPAVARIRELELELAEQSLRAEAAQASAARELEEQTRRHREEVLRYDAKLAAIETTAVTAPPVLKLTTHEPAARPLTKADIVAALSKRFAYKHYLELTSETTGYAFGDAMAAGFTTCRRLVYNLKGPHPDGLPVDYSSSSADIFNAVEALERENPRFDIALVDPYHTYDISLRDLRTAFRLVRPGGAVVVHDCLPEHELVASPEFQSGSWAGVTYRAFVDFCLANPAFDYFTIDSDWGCGVIVKSTSPIRIAKNVARALRQRPLAKEWQRVDANYEVLYKLFERRRVELLRLGGPALLELKLA